MEKQPFPWEAGYKPPKPKCPVCKKESRDDLANVSHIMSEHRGHLLAVGAILLKDHEIVVATKKVKK